ncbi:MAG TPA: thioredoxin domain-containing protein [Gammaproteobacteria bacterium]|nr:thioredoxin domain-containing protein [Gammaproteobacteria bacterium]
MSYSFPLPARILPQALVLLAAIAAAAVLPANRAAAQNATTVKGSAEANVVATVDNQSVTEGELEAYVAPQLMTLRQQRQDVLEKGLDNYLAEQVLTREAKAQGLSVNDLIEKQVTSKIKAPSDKEIDAFYESNKDRISAPKAQIVPRIKEYLAQQRQQQAFADYAEALKMKYGVKVLLKPLRVDVASADEPYEGPKNAPVALVEFGDFQCPYCAGLESTLAEVRKHYGDKVKLVFRQYPLESIHPQAFKAAEASMCAREQGKFWKLHDVMYGDQKKLSVPDLKASAKQLGINAKQFNQCLDTGKYEKAIRADMLAGEKAGVSGTPALFVNGRPVPGGAVPYETLAKIIDDELTRQTSASNER